MIQPVFDIVNCGPRHQFWANGKLVHNSDKINLQNLSKRAKDPVLRRSMKAPPNHLWVAADSSQIEARLNAYMSCQIDLVQLFIDGRDPYIDMATAIFGLSYDEIYEVSKVNPTKEGEMMRNLGKEAVLACISEDTEVLCKRGWVAIQDIRPDDLLWDGEDWVPHEGVVSMGSKDCIDFCGVHMTPDHRVYDGEEWSESENADGTKVKDWASRNLPTTK